MKRFNKNILVFIFAIIFIITGLSFRDLQLVLGNARNVLFGKSSIEIAEKNVDTITSQRLKYHNLLLDFNSIKDNLLGTRIVQKDETTVIKSDSDSLITSSDRLSEFDITQVVKRIEELKEVAESNNAKFLYCAAPTKEIIDKTPSNINDYTKENYLEFIRELECQNIPYLDFTESLGLSEGMEKYPFYYTDHHWTTNTGFDATKSICETLNKKYGFDYNQTYLDLDNYNVKSYHDWFLGSYGKKVGTFFTWRGADDFELIIPSFDTNITEKQPFKDETRNGSFEDTVLDMSLLKKDYYNISAYHAYSGGDFRLQIIKNNLNPKGKKVLLIRDSFACVVAPFLSLQTSELHVCDVRDGEYYVGDKLNMKDYIKEIKPNYVIVLYKGINSIIDGRYNFF